MKLLAACSNVRLTLSGLETFEHASRLESVAPVIAEMVAMFGTKRCLFGSNLPVEKLWTDYASPRGTFRAAIAQLDHQGQGDILHDTASRLYAI